MNKRIFVIEDITTQKNLMLWQLKENGFEAEGFNSSREALIKLKEDPPDVVITDYKMPDMNGIDLLCEIKRLDPDIPVIFMTGYGTIDLAVSAMKKGAFDFLTKPYNSDVLIYTVKRALHVKNLQEENMRLHMELMDHFAFDSIVGGSKCMKELFKEISNVAMSDATCLIEGESGTGKEIVARAIHYEGLRKSEPFVVVNCGAISENLIESELFGYEKGSFSTATCRNTGKLEQADSGTLFLDEIANLPLIMQSKLLSVLERKEVTRIGGKKSMPVNIRVIASTNCHLLDLVRKKEFREDLFYRLNVLPIRIPSLKDRKEDIPLLTRHFLIKNHQPHMHVDHDVINIFLKYDWPGNVRELENIIERMLIMSSATKTLRTQDIPIEIKDAVHSTPLKKVA